ncbi:hypothetical protein [Clostridium tyrobutyricum]|uniref:hypothetical protein n=1 Tax=Clostridium tyrobutyricum TaxID=1519 RepID=UPI00057C5095|nr:hypothetical protein [Clostridium tyrobutyricum]
MSYSEDAIKQFKLILNQYGNTNIKEIYRDNLMKVFCTIYAINYLSNRIDLQNFFNSNYYKISFSCLLESFSLILNNYPRGTSLVLRSSLENFIKHLIETSNNINGKQYSIHDRSYSRNKKTMEEVINNEYVSSLKEKSISLNSQMETQYKRLSGLSHSLTIESKNNIVKYFSDIAVLNKDNLDTVFEKLFAVLDQIFSFCIIICQPSLKEWDSHELGKILKMTFGARKTESFKKMLKS